MNISETAVTNAANLSLFMVNVSQHLLCDLRLTDPDCSILDRKALYRGARYVTEAIKMLPQKPEPVLLAHIFKRLTLWAGFRRLNPRPTRLDWRRYCSY